MIYFTKLEIIQILSFYLKFRKILNKCDKLQFLFDSRNETDILLRIN